MAQAIRIGILDDHPIILHGIAKVLESSPGTRLKVVVTATTIPLLLHKLETTDIDILMLDLSLSDPVHNSLSTEGRKVLPLLKEKHPNIKVVIYSQFNDDSLRAELVAEGASSYLCKNDDTSRLADILRAVKKDGSHYDQKTAQAMSRKLKKRNPANDPGNGILAGWKPEHIECARLTAKGCSVKETANAMHKSEDSVRGYRKLIYKKTGCGKATELAIWANDKNLFQEDNNH